VAAVVPYRMKTERIGRGWHEMGPIRPPNEGRDCSLLLRVTRNCPWNRCTFCRTYKGERYSRRSAEEITGDLEVVKALADEIRAASWRLGLAGDVGREVVAALINGNPELYGRRCGDAELAQRRIQSLVNVANWLASGGRTVFLQDADALQAPTKDLRRVLAGLRESFPGVVRVTSYSRAKTVARKSPEELRSLREAGLVRLHIGLESGCDEVLAQVRKGVTAEELILAGRKAREAGMDVSLYVMPGLGGRRLSERHALETARVLNAIGPDFIRLRTLVPYPGTPLYEQVEAGEFEPLSEDEVVAEIGLLIEHLDCRSYLTSDHMFNLLWEVEGRLPEDRPALLKTIAEYLGLPPHERLRVQLERRLSSYLAVAGGLPDGVAAAVREAAAAVEDRAPDAPRKVERALGALKQAFG